MKATQPTVHSACWSRQGLSLVMVLFCPSAFAEHVRVLKIWGQAARVGLTSAKSDRHGYAQGHALLMCIFCKLLVVVRA